MLRISENVSENEWNEPKKVKLFLSKYHAVVTFCLT